MKNVPLLLLLLLNVHTSEVRSQPYQANGSCLKPATEYKLDGSNLCCKKCQPGERLKGECSNNSETVCEPCPLGQYIETWNYSPNCFPCKKCTPSRGLRSIQNCSARTMSKCGCETDMFCVTGFRKQHCSSCARYSSCRVGYGVYKLGTADSDVKCKQCADGTFSDKDSTTEPCRPHKRCNGRVIKPGNATADTVCQPGDSEFNLPLPTTAQVFATSAAIVVPDSEVSPGDVEHSPVPPPSTPLFNHSIKSSQPKKRLISDINLALIICLPVMVLLLLSTVLLLRWKTVCRRLEAEKFHPKVDANGNCGPSEKMNQGFYGETQLASLNVTPPEQECLLETREPSGSDRSADTLTRTENCSSAESIVPPWPTLPLHDPSPEASLFSAADVLPPLNGVHAQSSSQPATPQMISPVTASPHVNVNITFHIGNGSGGTTKVSSTDRQVDPHLRFGEEEEASGALRQEAGKQFVMSVQESAG